MIFYNFIHLGTTPSSAHQESPVLQKTQPIPEHESLRSANDQIPQSRSPKEEVDFQQMKSQMELHKSKSSQKIQQQQQQQIVQQQHQVVQQQQVVQNQAAQQQTLSQGMLVFGITCLISNLICYFIFCRSTRRNS